MVMTNARITPREETKKCRFLVCINDDNNDRARLCITDTMEAAREQADLNFSWFYRGGNPAGDWIEIMDTHTGKVLYRTRRL